MKAKKYSIVKIIILVILLIAIIIGGIIVYGKITSYIDEKKIRGDIEKNLAHINEGDLSWVEENEELPELAPEIVMAMDSSRTASENKGLPERIISATEVGYTLNKVDRDTYDVVFTCEGYSFEDYISYCSAQGISTNVAMREEFSEYKEKHEPTYHNEISLQYEKENGKWHCKYDTPEFLDCMSCGMITVYREYYQDLEKDVTTFMGGLEPLEDMEGSDEP